MKFRRPTVENKAWTWWLASALGFGLLAAAITYWASLWLAPLPRIAPAGALSDQSGPLNLAQAKALFGKQAGAVAAPVTNSTIKVIGIIAAGPRGSAILSIDGKPGKAFAVGDKINDQLSLLGVDARQVTVGTEGKDDRQALAVPALPDMAILTRGPSPGASSGAAGTPPGGPAGALSTPGQPPVMAPPANPTPTSPLSPPGNFSSPAGMPGPQAGAAGQTGGPATGNAGLPPSTMNPAGTSPAQSAAPSGIGGPPAFTSPGPQNPAN